MSAEIRECECCDEGHMNSAYEIGRQDGVAAERERCQWWINEAARRGKDLLWALDHIALGDAIESGEDTDQ